MAEIGYASLGIIPSFRDFGGELERGSSKHLAAAGESGGRKFGDAAGRSAGRRFGSVFKTAAKVSLVGLAGAGALAFKLGKDSVSAASDLNESLNAVNVTYGKQARAVKKLGREAAETLGLSNTEFNGLSVRFAGFAKTIAGKDKKKVVSSLDDLTTRAADFASVMNLEVNEAAELFQSGLAGETEPLRRYGLDLSAAAVQAHAFATGIASGKGELTEAEKVQGRYSLLMKQTAKSQGDFANTSDSLANRQRILNARWDDARAKLGQGLLPYMEDLSGWVLDKGLPAFEDFSEWFNSKGIPAIQDFAEDIQPLVKSALPAFADILGTARDALTAAAPKAKEMIDAFNNMPGWAKTAIAGGGISLGIGTKLGLGKLGGKAAGGLIRNAKPIPVFVVNEGFGGAGAGGKKGWLKALGAWGTAGAVTAGAGVVLEHETPLRTQKNPAGGVTSMPSPGTTAGGLIEEYAKGRNLFPVLGKVAEFVADIGDESDTSKGKAHDMNRELSRRIKLNVDNRPVDQAIEATRQLISELETLNSLDVRLGGAEAVHRGKLYGDSYQLNFNGVDLAGAKREITHNRRAAAVGGQDFTDD